MDYNYDDGARALLEDAERLAIEQYKREFLGTDCLLMAVVRASGKFSEMLAEQGATEERVNRRILYLVGEEFFKNSYKQCPPVADVRLVLYRSKERAIRRGGVTENVTVGDITIELLKYGGTLSGVILRTCTNDLQLLIKELVKLNGDPDEDSKEAQTTLHEMENQLRIS